MQHPTGTEDYSIRGKFKVPLQFHVGSMGLAQATNVTVDSVPPMMGGTAPTPTPLLVACHTTSSPSPAP